MDYEITSWAANEVNVVKEQNKLKVHEDFDRDKYNNSLDTALDMFKVYHKHLDDKKKLDAQFVYLTLMQLLRKQPLAPINDTDEDWNMVKHIPEVGSLYYHKRLPTLTKMIRELDHATIYHDIGRYYAIDIGSRIGVIPNNPNVDDVPHTYVGGLPGKILDDIFPITFPYFPINKYVIYTHVIYDNNSGDTYLAILKITTPENEKMDVNRYFKQKQFATNDEWDEINFEEFQAAFKANNKKEEVEDSDSPNDTENKTIELGKYFKN